ncbi:MAG: hypothetical protein ACXADW_23555 [Candidatus Hodarchaeales archaeon]|jgi:hypothetical protein
MDKSELLIQDFGDNIKIFVDGQEVYNGYCGDIPALERILACLGYEIDISNIDCLYNDEDGSDNDPFYEENFD